MYSIRILLFSLFLWGVGSGAEALTVALKEVARGAGGVVSGTALPGAANADRVLTLELGSGRIAAFDRSAGTSTVVVSELSIDGTPLSDFAEATPLSVIASPDFAASGHVYVSALVRAEGGLARNVVKRLTLDPVTLADQGGATSVFSLNAPASRAPGGHAGGALAFDGAGALYLTTGDGRSAFGSGPSDADIQNPALGVSALFRIDPTGDDFPGDSRNNFAIPEDNPVIGGGAADGLVALGLRNPFKASYDPIEDRLFIGDVGQSAREEIDAYTLSDGLVNFGWPRFEGTLDFSLTAPLSGDVADPLYEYAHGEGALEGFAVTGGLVNRGPEAILDGMYVFGDFGRFPLSERNIQPFFAFDAALETVAASDILLLPQVYPEGGALGRMLSFTQDAEGRLYVGDFSGGLFAIAAVPLPPSLGLALLGFAALFGLGRGRRIGAAQKGLTDARGRFDQDARLAAIG